MLRNLLIALALSAFASGTASAQCLPPDLASCGWDVWNPVTNTDTGADFDAWEIADGEYVWEASMTLPSGEIYTEWGFATRIYPGLYEYYNVTKNLEGTYTWNQDRCSYVKQSSHPAPRELRARPDSGG